MDKIEIFIAYTKTVKGNLGTGNCQCTVDGYPESLNDLQMIARDIEKLSGYDKKSVVIISWHVWESSKVSALESEIERLKAENEVMRKRLSLAEISLLTISTLVSDYERPAEIAYEYFEAVNKLEGE